MYGAIPPLPIHLDSILLNTTQNFAFILQYKLIVAVYRLCVAHTETQQNNELEY
jgi:hypothetical protein